jgi:hypothetical protein
VVDFLPPVVLVGLLLLFCERLSDKNDSFGHSEWISTADRISWTRLTSPNVARRVGNGIDLSRKSFLSKRPSPNKTVLIKNKIVIDETKIFVGNF